MSDSRSSNERLGGGPISETEVDAMVAEVYLAASAPPDQARLESIRQQFRRLHGTDNEVDKVAFSDATDQRPEETYVRKKVEGLLIRLYKTKLDRAAGLVLATATVLTALAVSMNMVTLSGTQLIAGTMAMVGVLLGAGVFESCRLGYLAHENWKHIDDLGASLPAFVVRGHHKVHEAEQEMLRRARVGKPERLMLVELWNRQRCNPGTEPSATVEREVDALVRAHPDCRVRSAVSATRKTWEQRAELLRRRCGKVEQRFFLENPLQVDAILTDNEAILSFPRGNGDRGLAVVFRSKGVVKELWDVFESQVGKATTARSIPITSDDDIDTIKGLVNDDERPVGAFPHDSFKE